MNHLGTDREIANLQQLVRIAGREMMSAENRYQQALLTLAEIQTASITLPHDELAVRVTRLIDDFTTELDSPSLDVWRRVGGI